MKLPSYSFLIPASLLLGLAPFAPEPHLVEKIRWLFTGQPFRPIDVFDLFLHGSLPALLLIKVGRDLILRPGAGSDRGSHPAPGPGPSPREPREPRRKGRERARGTGKEEPE